MEINEKDLLLKAVAQRKIKLIKLLLQGGVNINNTGYDGKTPLIVACSFVPEKCENETLMIIIECLLKNGANPNLQDIKGRTAIMYAFRHAISFEIIDKLLQNGAEPLITDFDGLNAFDFISDTVWPKYRHYLKSSEQYKRRLMKTEENNNVVDIKEESLKRGTHRTSLTVLQNSMIYGGRLAYARNHTFRRTSDIPLSVCDASCSSTRKTHSFSVDINENCKQLERNYRLHNELTMMSKSEKNFNLAIERLPTNLQEESPVKEYNCKARQNKHSNLSLVHSCSKATEQTECINISKCKQSKLNLSFLNNVSPRSQQTSATLVKVSSIDKATVEDGMIKTLTKLPPIQ